MLKTSKRTIRILRASHHLKALGYHFPNGVMLTNEEREQRYDEKKKSMYP